jgi:two-component system, OmpR family, response regulator
MTTGQHHRSRTRIPIPTQPSIQRIVVVDDDDSLRRLLRNMFEASGFSVTEARNEAELMSALKTHKIALITLDLSLRLEDGLSIARAVRSFSDVPIIMVTGRAQDVDRIVGLEVGADDYIVKPFNVREVLARVRAVLRRTNARPDLPVESDHDLRSFSGFVIDFAARELRKASGHAIAVTNAEFKLLEAFVTHPGRVLSRDALIDYVGGADAVPLERSIDTIVGRLRKKIEADCATPKIIKTVRGAGYIFTAKLHA